jgi:hypothetical protein
LPIELRVPRLTGQRINEVRQGMTGRGFALVNTPPFFGDDLVVRLKREKTVLSPQNKRWHRFQALARYACWLEDLLGAALPDEVVSLAALEFRHEPAGLEDAQVDRLHADGSYIRSVYTLFGPATIYREEGVDRPVPERRTLLMTATDRARAIHLPCTLHRRPGPGPERAVVVCSFEPSPEQRPASVYREVAEALGRYRKRGRHSSDRRNHDPREEE